MNKHVVIIKLLFVIIIGLFISCNLLGPKNENNPPEIISLFADTTMIVQEENTSIRCEAVDPNEDILHYSWETTRGTISGVGPSVTYIAPLKTGNYRITCYVDDEQGGKDTANLTISVVYEFKRDTIADIDENLYKAVRIGDQWWMAENLKVTHYNNGDAISSLNNNYNFDNKAGVFADVLDYANFRHKYGLNYNFYAIADERGLAPEGWHVATDDDWRILEDFIDSMCVIYNYSTTVSTKLIMSIYDWDFSSGIDVFEFCAYPVEGFEISPTSEQINWIQVGYRSKFWTASEYNDSTAWYRTIGGYYFDRLYVTKYYGMQVRCVKDSD